MATIQVNMHEAKTNLSRYVQMVENGDTVILARHGKPVIQFAQLPEKMNVSLLTGPVFGCLANKLELTDAFFEPYTDEEMGFTGFIGQDW